MTLEELQVATAATLEKVTALAAAVEELDQFILRADTAVNDTVTALAIDVDAFVAAQAPVYAAHLVAIEVAADALGTDN